MLRKLLCLILGHEWWSQAREHLMKYGAENLPYIFTCERCGNRINIKESIFF